jgi:hypothetical protein
MDVRRECRAHGGIMARDCWTVCWADYETDDDGDRGVQRHEVVRDRAALAAKIVAVGPGCVVVPGEPLVFYVDTSPRITFEEQKKPRAPRSDKGKPRRKKAETDLLGSEP